MYYTKYHASLFFLLVCVYVVFRSFAVSYGRTEIHGPSVQHAATNHLRPLSLLYETARFPSRGHHHTDHLCALSGLLLLSLTQQTAGHFARLSDTAQALHHILHRFPNGSIHLRYPETTNGTVMLSAMAAFPPYRSLWIIPARYLPVNHESA